MGTFSGFMVVASLCNMAGATLADHPIAAAFFFAAAVGWALVFTLEAMTETTRAAKKAAR